MMLSLQLRTSGERCNSSHKHADYPKNYWDWDFFRNFVTSLGKGLQFG